MSHRQIDCLACGSAFTVDDGQDAARCASCGTNHAAPWDAPSILSSPILDGEEIRRANTAGTAPASQQRTEARQRPATDGGRAMAIDTEGGTVEIVIRILD